MPCVALPTADDDTNAKTENKDEAERTAGRRRKTAQHIPAEARVARGGGLGGSGLLVAVGASGRRRRLVTTVVLVAAGGGRRHGELAVCHGVVSRQFGRKDRVDNSAAIRTHCGERERRARARAMAMAMAMVRELERRARRSSRATCLASSLLLLSVPPDYYYNVR